MIGGIQYRRKLLPAPEVEYLAELALDLAFEAIRFVQMLKKRGHMGAIAGLGQLHAGVLQRLQFVDERFDLVAPEIEFDCGQFQRPPEKCKAVFIGIFANGDHRQFPKRKIKVFETRSVARLHMRRDDLAQAADQWIAIGNEAGFKISPKIGGVGNARLRPIEHIATADRWLHRRVDNLVAGDLPCQR